MTVLAGNHLQKVADERQLCPRCKTPTYLDRVHRGLLVKALLGYLPLRRYRCYRCKRRFYMMKQKQSLN